MASAALRKQFPINLLHTVTPIEGIKRGTDVVPEARRNGAEVGMLYEDPLFDTDAFKQKIFRFKPGSPATKLGIEPIDLSSVGSTLAKQEVGNNNELN